MIAIVMSGAGARGPLQVGAMQALLEAGVKPDLMVGTSAGAINAAFVAARGFCQSTLETMQARWRSVTARTVYPGNWLTAGWRFIRGQDSLYSSSGLRRLVREGLPDDVYTFGDLKLPLYVTSVDIKSNRLFLFGESPRAPVVDAVLASATVPGIHPPVAYYDLQLVDGGVLANVAGSVAMDKGATELWVLNAGYSGDPEPHAQGIVEILFATLTTMMAQTLLEDLARATADTTVDLHHIVLRPPQPVSFRDFTQADDLHAAGYAAAKAYLAEPAPRTVAQRAPRPIADLGEAAPGVREFVPPYWRV